MEFDKIYMQRCLQLAELGAGYVAPNPMVGAVLVYQERIIGEGFHEQYGQPHAEVNCINSVKEVDRLYIPDSTLYVSLEPCAHFGKTPPCADLILRHKIKKVVVALRDPFNEVDGKGIEKLRAAGVEVVTGVLEKQAAMLNKRFLHFHQYKQPFIILKWAESLNGAIAAEDNSQTAISAAFTNRLVHGWRAQEAAILVGATTAVTDNPSLTVRLVKGNNPLRLLIDPELRVPASSHLLDGLVPTILYNYHKSGTMGALEWVKLERSAPLQDQLLADCYKRKILSILVEGGTRTLQSFLDAGCWEEIRQIRSRTLILENGYQAPLIKKAVLQEQFASGTDDVLIYHP